MTLLAILLALAAGHFLPQAAALRSFAWFEHWSDWVHNMLSDAKGVTDPIETAIVIGVPVVVAAAVYLALLWTAWPVAWIFGALLLFYAIGPADLMVDVARYRDAAEADSPAAARGAAAHLLQPLPAGAEALDWDVVGAIFVELNRRVFAALFWFVVAAGPGALFYRLAVIQRKRMPGRADGAARSLRDLLEWAPARLVAAGFGLAGSLIDMVTAWRQSGVLPVRDNDKLLRATGIAALQLPAHEVGPVELNDDDRRFRLHAAEGPALRCLLAWVTVLALVTIGGLMP